MLLLLLLLLGEEHVELGAVALQELSELAVELVSVFCQLGLEGIRDVYRQGLDSLLSALRHRLDLVNTGEDGVVSRQYILEHLICSRICVCE